MGRERINLNSRDETLLFASKLAKTLAPNSILALKGELGAGKTTFVQGLLQGLNIEDTAQSPTFTYLHIYDGPVYHFDLYRLPSGREFHLLGFDEFLKADGIAVIEWPEKIEKDLPADTIWIELFHASTGRIAEWEQR